MGLSKNRTNISFLIILALKISSNLKEKFHLNLTTFDMVRNIVLASKQMCIVS